MSEFKKCLLQLEDKFGGIKDNVIGLSTISLSQSSENLPISSVRDVDAHYSNGCFYIVTHALTHKVKQISMNPNVAIVVPFEGFTAHGTGENLGWVLEPKNKKLRIKLREVFSKWYDEANDESDQNCCFLKIELKDAVLMEGHADKFYHINFIEKSVNVIVEDYKN